MESNIRLAAKISHVPSIYLGEQSGPNFGIRKNLREGLQALGQRCRELEIETLVVLDVHWINTIGFHLNAAPHHQGSYTSHELPHFIAELEYDYPGDPELAALVEEEGRADGMSVRAHKVKGLGLEYACLIPMRYMNPDGHFRLLPIGQNINAAWQENKLFGQALRRAIERSGRKVALLASGSLSHQMWRNDLAEQGLSKISSEFNRQCDEYVIGLWQAGKIEEFLDYLPTYLQVCKGECRMSDTVQLFGALGWEKYRGQGRIYGYYEAASGTGQVNMEFPVNNLPDPVPAGQKLDITGSLL